MTRPTENERRQAGVENHDPAAPLFDAVDRLHRRLNSTLSSLRGTASAAAQEIVVPELRRSLLRGFFVLSALVAIGSTALAISLFVSVVHRAETRAFAGAAALDEERSRSFAARVEQVAAQLAASRVAEADRRAMTAEAEASNAKATVLAVVGKSSDEDVRALLSALITTSRGDVNVVWKVLRNPDPNVRRLALKATEISSAELGRILFYLEKGGR